MEYRKVQRVGASTLSVSLPNDWVKSVGLKKGDVVFFDQDDDGTLKIMTDKQIEKEYTKAVEINADLCKNPHMLSRVLKGVYSLGYDSIRVTSADRLKSEQLTEIRELTHSIMGIGIMEETRNQVMIQCSIDLTKFPLQTLLRRLYIIASTMHKETIESLSKFDESVAEEAIRRKEEAETMFWVIVRLLNSGQRDKLTAKKLNIEEPMDILWYRFIAQYLRLIADWSARNGEKVIALKKNREMIGEYLLEEMVKINERAYGVCHMAINSFFSNDIDLANQAIDAYSEIQKTEELLQESICNHAYLHGKSFSVTKYFKGKKPIEPCMVAQISFIIWGARRIAELGSEIAEIAIHKTLSRHTNLCRETAK